MPRRSPPMAIEGVSVVSRPRPKARPMRPPTRRRGPSAGAGALAAVAVAAAGQARRGAAQKKGARAAIASDEVVEAVGGAGDASPMRLEQPRPGRTKPSWLRARLSAELAVACGRGSRQKAARPPPPPRPQAGSGGGRCPSPRRRPESRGKARPRRPLPKRRRRKRRAAKPRRPVVARRRKMRKAEPANAEAACQTGQAEAPRRSRAAPVARPNRQRQSPQRTKRRPSS